jgi:hypothetical protein
MARIDSRSAISAASSSRSMAPRAAWRGVCWDASPYLFALYATVDGERPTSRAMDSIERPDSSCDLSQASSMTRTLVRAADGTAPGAAQAKR